MSFWDTIGETVKGIGGTARSVEEIFNPSNEANFTPTAPAAAVAEPRTTPETKAVEKTPTDKALEFAQSPAGLAVIGIGALLVFKALD